MADEIENMSKEEQIGFHKGSINTLLKEREEMVKIIGIIDSFMKLHYEALTKLGVDLSNINNKSKESDTKGLEESV